MRWQGKSLWYKWCRFYDWLHGIKVPDLPIRKPPVVIVDELNRWMKNER